MAAMHVLNTEPETRASLAMTVILLFSSVVPDRPPTDINVFSLGTDTVQIEWSPVPPEYTNGEVLGYRVLYNDVNDTSRANITVDSQKETRLRIDELRSDTNYSFQILAFTGKGDGTRSANYFAKTGSFAEINV